MADNSGLFRGSLGKRWKTPIQANNKKEKAELCN